MIISTLHWLATWIPLSEKTIGLSYDVIIILLIIHLFLELLRLGANQPTISGHVIIFLLKLTLGWPLKYTIWLGEFFWSWKKQWTHSPGDFRKITARAWGHMKLIRQRRRHQSEKEVFVNVFMKHLFPEAAIKSAFHNQGLITGGLVRQFFDNLTATEINQLFDPHGHKFIEYFLDKTQSGLVFNNPLQLRTCLLTSEIFLSLSNHPPLQKAIADFLFAEFIRTKKIASV